MRVNVLHSNIKINGNELAFLFPIKFNAKRLKVDYNISVNYFQNISERLYECDILIISSWYIGRGIDWWQNENENRNRVERA